jgi:ribokinase
MPRILVVGSANMDLVVRAPRMPVGGETIMGRDFSTVRGGKGANQAIACARMGAEVWMLGCVGCDAFGDALVAGLESDGVRCDLMRQHPTTPSGIAIIIIDAEGENSIVVATGANAELTAEDVARVEDLGRFDAVLTQLEAPLDAVQATLARARETGVLSILDAGPPSAEASVLLGEPDVLSPNETEAKALLGVPVTETVEPEEAADQLVARGARSVVLKLGAEGALVAGPECQEPVPAFRVDPVDTTGAGDAFTAALAVSLARGESLVRATTIGAAAGALAATVFGAAPSMPTAEAVERFMRERGHSHP